MLPFIFEWHWTIDRLVFMGLLYACLTLIGVGLTLAFLKTYLNVTKGDHSEHH